MARAADRPMLFRFVCSSHGGLEKIYGPWPLSGFVRDYAERTDCFAVPQELAARDDAWRPAPAWAAEYPSLLASEEQQAEMERRGIAFDRFATVAMADALLDEATLAASPEAAEVVFSLTAQSPMVYRLSESQGDDEQIHGPIPLEQLVREYGTRTDCRAAPRQKADDPEEWSGMPTWGLYLRRLSAN